MASRRAILGWAMELATAAHMGDALRQPRLVRLGYMYEDQEIGITAAIGVFTWPGERTQRNGSGLGHGLAVLLVLFPRRVYSGVFLHGVLDRFSRR